MKTGLGDYHSGNDFEGSKYASRVEDFLLIH